MKSAIQEAITLVVESSDTKIDRGFMKYADQRRTDRLARLLPKLDAAMAGGDIWNVDWVELKDEISRVLGAALSQVGGKLRAAQLEYMKSHPDYRDKVFGPTDEYTSAYPHMVEQKLKKLKTSKVQQTIKKEEPYMTEELFQDLIRVYEEFESVAAALSSTKDKVKKGRQPNPNAKPAYVPPRASIASLKKIQDKVEEVTQSMYDDLVKSYKKYFNGLVDHYFSVRKQDSHSPYSTKQFEGPLAGVVSSFLTNIPEGKSYAGMSDPYRKRDDYEARIERASKEQADIVRDRYKAKMMEKLGSIVGKKAEKGVPLKSVSTGHLTAHSGTFEGWMLFEFEDGSKFDVLNKVITKWSQRGQPFHQYPTTFHNVKLPNGEGFKMRSEEQMNKDFIEGNPDSKKS